MPEPQKKSSISTAPLSGLVVFALALAIAACGEGTQTGAETRPATTGGQNETTGPSPSAAREYVLPGDEVFPEGIAYRSETGDFFVGSTTDGTIFRASLRDGSRKAEVFLEPRRDGRTTAIGMDVDDEGRLFISGGDTGRMFVYDAGNGDLIRALDTPPSETTFINDVAVTPEGDAYFTDSMRPVLFRVPASAGELSEAEPWLDFRGTALEYEEGFNANGIVAAHNGRYLIVVQSNTGEIFRIDTQSQEVVEIDLGGETMTNGDGLVLDGQTLYVVRNQQEVIVPIELSDDLTSGEADEGFTHPSFRYPTTAAKTDSRLLVVNSQFDRREGEPELPFTVSSVEVP